MNCRLAVLNDVLTARLQQAKHLRNVSGWVVNNVRLRHPKPDCLLLTATNIHTPDTRPESLQ